MTYQYLSTARSNAIPRPEHVGTPATRPAPQFDNPDALREAMMADARKMAGNKPRIGRPPLSKPSEQKPMSRMQAEIFKFIEASPGSSSREICEALGVMRGTLSSSIQRLRKNGYPVSTQINASEARFWIGDVPDARRLPPSTRPVRLSKIESDVFAFIQDNPGIGSDVVMEELGLSRPQFDGASRRLREKNVGLRIKRRGGKPAQFWVEGAQ